MRGDDAGDVVGGQGRRGSGVVLRLGRLLLWGFRERVSADE